MLASRALQDLAVAAHAPGAHNDLLVVGLDVARREDAESAVRAAVDRFGRIDVLVNNAGVSYKGYFGEMTPDEIDRQLAVDLVGPVTVTHAVLPVMRARARGTSSRSRRAPG